jgi:hypothetical protein
MPETGKIAPTLLYQEWRHLRALESGGGKKRKRKKEISWVIMYKEVKT